MKEYAQCKQKNCEKKAVVGGYCTKHYYFKQKARG